MISVIIPFCNTDKHLVYQAIDSILIQKFLDTVYVVGDGIDKKDSVLRNLISKYNNKPIRFFTALNIGPYAITNSIVKYNVSSKVIALQDADDISFPNRFQEQIEHLIEHDHSSAAMKQIAQKSYKGHRHITEPILTCGAKAINVPKGRFINSTRMIKTSTFQELNGFSNMFCSGDLAFDNIIRALNIPSYECQKVLAIRRLHGSSLTNHPNTTRHSKIRQTCMTKLYADLKIILKSPTLETARSIGNLNNAQPLPEV